MSSTSLAALRDYRYLPAAFGSTQMLSAALARAPYAMMPLGIMTAFTASTGDIALGGLATSFFSIAVAVCSPFVGRAADLWGQRRVLMIITPINAVAILGLYWAAVTSFSGPALFLLCLVAGASGLPVGSFTRARWVSMDRPPKVLMAAFSYESMADEMVFVLGPALVGISATAGSPSTPLLVAFVLIVVAGTPFALMAPGPHAISGSGAAVTRPPAIRRIILAVAPAIVILIAVGSFFGSSQAATTVRADELGSPNVAGLVYAVMGISSAVAALLVVVLPDSFRMPARFISFSLALSLATVATAHAGSLPSTALLLFVAGAFISPILVTAFTLSEKLAPPGGIAVAMTLMSSSVTVGVSLGSAVGGAIAESSGSLATYLFSASVVGLVTLVGILLAAQNQRSRRVSHP